MGRMPTPLAVNDTPRLPDDRETVVGTAGRVGGVRREEVAFANGSVHLGGEIVLPQEVGRSSGLVLIAGSGPSDRHNGGFFDLLSEHLVGSGIAVLVYDKRGTGRSTGRWETATVDELAGDADAALAALEAHGQVASEAVGVLGHSEGGWVAARLCSRKRPGRRVVLSSCPSVSFMDAEQFALTAAGASRDAARAVRLLFEELTQAAESGCELPEGRRLLSAARDEAWYAAVEASGFVLNDASWSVLRAWGSHDPHDDLRALTSPTLVILGAEDVLVPVQPSVARYEATAREAGRPQEIVVFPDADHRLHSSSTGDLTPNYLSKLSEWTLQRA